MEQSLITQWNKQASQIKAPAFADFKKQCFADLDEAMKEGDALLDDEATDDGEVFGAAYEEAASIVQDKIVEVMGSDYVSLNEVSSSLVQEYFEQNAEYPTEEAAAQHIVNAFCDGTERSLPEGKDIIEVATTLAYNLEDIDLGDDGVISLRAFLMEHPSVDFGDELSYNDSFYDMCADLFDEEDDDEENEDD